VPFFQESTTTAMRQAPAHWNFILIALANEPHPLTINQLHAIYPYTSRQAIEDALQPHLDNGFLKVAQDSDVGPHGEAADFRVTEKGQALVDGFFHAAHEALEGVSPLPRDEMIELRDLLRAIVENARSPLPKNESIFHAGRYSDPGPDAAPAAQIDQLVTDLYYFRDDAHIAAWRLTGLDGPAWEALTVLWREQAQTLSEIAERLTNRGHTHDDYAASVKDLADRGWVIVNGDEVQISSEGRQLREDAEKKTNENFFAPWHALDTSQIETLHTLLQQARDNLRSSARLRMWPLIVDVAGAMQPLVQQKVREVIQEELENRYFFNHMRMAREAEPQPYTIQRFLTRYPYANPQRASELLRLAVEAGYFERKDDDYMLTTRGQTVVDVINNTFYNALSQLEVLSDEQMERLVALLQRLVEAALKADAPSKACLQQTYNTARPRDYAPLALADIYADDLNAFRDDAHTTAWAAHFTGGRDWETLTRVWRDRAHNAAELAEQLTFRGWDQDAYQKSLDALVQRGWLQEHDGLYTITEKGNTLRQRVEEETDTLFYASWDQALTPQEQNELRTLLIRLKVQLNALQAEQEREDPAV
jgi:DNA-binding MarR family transcriptional regulator